MILYLEGLKDEKITEVVKKAKCSHVFFKKCIERRSRSLRNHCSTLTPCLLWHRLLRIVNPLSYINQSHSGLTVAYNGKKKRRRDAKTIGRSGKNESD